MNSTPGSTPDMPYSLSIESLGLPTVPLAPNETPDIAPCLSVSLAEAGGERLPAVVICPGGGYGYLANDHEGIQVARWFNARGVHAFILHYSLGPVHNHPTQVNEARTALAIVRAKADEWLVRLDRVGIMGFSAGGHLAASASTIGADTRGNAPDFAILGYPVITMKDPYTHQGSRGNLMGAGLCPELIAELSLEDRVGPFTPPTFIFHTTDDGAVPVENALAYYSSLRRAGVGAEMHLYAHGPHGVGLCLDDPVLGGWSNLLEGWLRVQGIIPGK